MKNRNRPTAEDSRCGWWCALPDPAPAQRLQGREHADWIVLGAGATGLAAARRLAEHRPNDRIVLLEAERVGAGPSGRNSGFLTDLGHYEKGASLDLQRRRIRLARAGIATLREQVQRHGIECDWSEIGRLHGAADRAAMHSLALFLAELDELGEPYEALDARKFETITGSAYYRAGAHLPGSVLVQPTALIRGLAEALPANVSLFEESPAIAIHPGDPLRIELESGSIEAPKLLLTTNAFSSSLGFLRDRMFPLSVFASLTRVLSEEEQASFGGDHEWGLVPEVPVGTSVRRTRDQRILIRNSASYAPRWHSSAATHARARAAQRQSLARRFPSLAEVEFETAWSGVVAISLNGMPYFGRPAANIHCSAVCNGVGVALGSALGMALADDAVAEDSDLLRDARALPRPTWLPPPPLLGIGVRPALAWMHHWAGAEI